MKPFLPSITRLAFALLLCAPASAQAPSGDACDLLTTEEVKAVLQTNVLPGQPVNGDKTFCLFAPGSEHNPSVRYVTIHLIPARVFEATKLSYRGSASEPATGIGDDAHSQTLATGKLHMVSLFVRTGSGSFSLHLNPGRDGTETDAQVKAMEETLARKAAARL